MSRECIVTGKKVMTGNNVSHANNKTRRRFLPNLQHVSFMSETLGERIQLRVSTAGLRQIEKNGGFDGFLNATLMSKLHDDLKYYKKRLEAKKA